MKHHQHIARAEQLIDALGGWPSFHDAEVISFIAERALPLRNGGTTARLTVHLRRHETVGEGTPQVEQVLRQSALVRFMFDGARDFELEGFNHQNVIDDITVTPAGTDEGGGCSVNIVSCWGFGGTLRCTSVAIEDVEWLPVEAS